jgi:hypothetical protein
MAIPILYHRLGPTGTDIASRRNFVSLFNDRATDKRNFNMQVEFETGWLTTRSTGDEAYNWHHSDFDYVAYPFVHKLFDEIVNDGNLKWKP